jgi:hypothetical protein
MMKVLDLFSGIGGFSYGLDKTGHFKTVAFCEINKFSRMVLHRHWPGIRIENDVNNVARSVKWKNSTAQTLLRLVSRARIYHTREKVPDFRESVLVYGGKSVEPFAWYDQASRCWRTWQRCLIEEWERYLEAWPQSGMTRNGIAYQLAPLARPTKESESILLPTIGANESKGSSSKRYKGSPHFRGAKMSEGLRTCQSDAIYTNPNFAEAAMGYPKDWTLVETR